MTSEIRSGGMQNYLTVCSRQTVRCPVQSGASRFLAPFSVPGRTSDLQTGLAEPLDAEFEVRRVLEGQNTPATFE